MSEFNRKMCESRSPVKVRETACSPGRCIPAVQGSVAEGLHRAKVGQADKPNQNGRIYPRELWARNLERIKPLLATGRVTGAVDHIGSLEGGNLSSSPIIWRNLELTADGAVYGDYEVVAGHSVGADLMAQHEAGMAIGFSTLGYGTAHEPSDAERRRFQLDPHDEAVVMDDNFELRKIDAVDDPSVEDAYRCDNGLAPRNEIREGRSDREERARLVWDAVEKELSPFDILATPLRQAVEKELSSNRAFEARHVARFLREKHDEYTEIIPTFARTIDVGDGVAEADQDETTLEPIGG